MRLELTALLVPLVSCLLSAPILMSLIAPPSPPPMALSVTSGS